MITNINADELIDWMERQAKPVTVADTKRVANWKNAQQELIRKARIHTDRLQNSPEALKHKLRVRDD